MDAIKNKMKSLKSETENAVTRANQLESEAKEANQRADKYDEQVRDLQKKMQHVENDLDTTMDKLTSTSSKLDEKDKAFQVAEAEIQALLRKLSLLQDELKRSESKLATTSADLNLATTQVDNIARAMKTLETKNMIDEGSEFQCLGEMKKISVFPVQKKMSLFTSCEDANFCFLIGRRGVFRVLILQVLSANRIVPLRVLTLADCNKSGTSTTATDSKVINI